jgi:hypothetical protein
MAHVQLRTQAQESLRAVQIPRADWTRLRDLPWASPLEAWRALGVPLIHVRRGESRHPVLFVEIAGRRYAIKETGPQAAKREIRALRELLRRRCDALEPVGYVITRGELVAAGVAAGRQVYLSGDLGYCVTRLAERALPQSLLYSFPFTGVNKRLLLNAVAALLLSLHESGVYWGDPSLANILISLSGRRLTALLADAETAEIVSGALDEGLRQQDLNAFVEAMEWQAEDIRLARGLREDAPLVTEEDASYFLSRYAGLRAERDAGASPAGTLFARLREFELRLTRLNALGYGVMEATTQTRRRLGGEARRAAEEEARHSHEGAFSIATIRPNWYVERVRDLLGVTVPAAFAARLYHHLSVHRWLLSERAGHDLPMKEVVRDWVHLIHEPALAFLHAFQPGADTTTLYATYVAILDHGWEMAKREERAVPIEEAAMDYALAGARPAPDATSPAQ